MSTFNLPPVHPSWDNFITTGVLELLRSTMDVVLNDGAITPAEPNILRFLSIDLDTAKVLILGQDPYPQPGVATGRAFEVGGLEKWDQPFSNTSLRNIARALYAAYQDEILNFARVRAKINQGNFQLLPPGKLFKYWESRGVLLLNTSLTCRLNEPGSHAATWLPFTGQLLSYVNQQKPDLVWMLWGNHARRATAHIAINHALLSSHPMICCPRPNDFLHGEINHFKATSHLVDWLGVKTPGFARERV